MVRLKKKHDVLRVANGHELSKSLDFVADDSSNNHAYKRPYVKWLGVVLGLWFVTIFLFPLISRMFFSGHFLNISYVIALLLPEIAFIFILKNLVPLRISTNDQVAIILFLISILISSMISIDKINSILFFVLTIVVFIIILQFKSYLRSEQYITAFKVYSLLALVITVMFAYYDYKPGVRLGNGTSILNPNAVSLILMSITIAGLSFSSYIAKISIVSVSIYLLYLTGSRTSLVAMFIGVTVYAFYATKVSSRYVKVLAVIILFVMVILGFAFYDSFWTLLNTFLKIDDSHRGISAGASGRLEIWSTAWALSLDNLMTGIGYRSHEKVLGISSHNGYLATLLEIGVIGFVSVMYLIIKGVYVLKLNISKYKAANYELILYSLCLAYLFLALFERYLVNIGNPMSLLFLLAVLAPLRSYGKKI